MNGIRVSMATLTKRLHQNCQTCSTLFLACHPFLPQPPFLSYFPLPLYPSLPALPFLLPPPFPSFYPSSAPSLASCTCLPAFLSLSLLPSSPLPSIHLLILPSSLPPFFPSLLRSFFLRVPAHLLLSYFSPLFLFILVQFSLFFTGYTRQSIFRGTVCYFNCHIFMAKMLFGINAYSSSI